LDTEQIVYLLRKTTLTRPEIGKLTPAQANEILREVYYQESMDAYNARYTAASVIAAIYNTIPRKRGSKSYKAEDLLQGGPPERGPKPQSSIAQIAQARGVRLPSKELKERG
jgi:hypothetical protein